VRVPNPRSGPDPVSLSDLQGMWQRLNSRFFDSRLPSISIEWSSRLTASTGLFVSQVGPRSRWVPSVYRQGDARVIRLSAPLLREQPEAELQRTLAHEMIHQWEFDIRKRRPSHGPTFREMMNRMNEEGLGIAIRHELNAHVAMWNRYAWECVRCGMAYHRQRRTIVPARHLCSRCRGALVEVPVERPLMAKPTILPEPIQTELSNEVLLPTQLRFNF